MQASYLKAYQDGTLDKAIEKAFNLLAPCRICPRRCKVNRIEDENGFCRTGLKPRVYSFMPHHGEEPPVSGRRGSGTIFFAQCNMRCVYCQNFEFSQARAVGEQQETAFSNGEVSFEELARVMLKLQDQGCHNINLVTPTHVMPQILKALRIAIGEGLCIPLVYNTGGYDLEPVIALLEGIVDVYLTDMRYSDDAKAVKYSSAPGYPLYNRLSVKEMHRQTGPAQMNEEGIIERGVIVRHLVLPRNISGTGDIMKFLAEEVSADTYISLMSQYRPYYRASGYPHLCRRITDREYSAAQEVMQHYGLHNGWVQEGRGLEKLAGVHIRRWDEVS
ncbi:MAG: radical SAM protein [Candidatus Omnitrophica bacterium]|nr:radical SAM protein [Candidatus Omnitrophota bacterium]